MLPENVTDWLINKGELMSVLKMYELYGLMLEDGIKAENARYILPEGSCSKIVVSMNLRSLLNFFHTRLCDSAQEEIRFVAKCMADLVIKEFPWLKGYVGPKCVRDDKCLDGRGFVCEEHYAWRDKED
jgi:thymidylate synthase (FAD)